MEKLGFGLMRLPQTDPNIPSSVDIEAFKKMADVFIAAGGTYFDTAYPYHGGSSETAFREAVVKRYPRDAYTVTDKLPMFLINKKEEIPRIFEEQLARCGVEYFDYYWLHSLGKISYEKSEELQAFAYIAQKKAEGKIRHIGFSFHDAPELLEEILSKHPEMEYVQLQINYIDWDDPAIRARECYEIATRYGKPVIVMEPVKGGALANIPEQAEQLLKECRPSLSTASWAVRFAASLDNVMMVLSGMSNQAQLEDNLSYMKHFAPLDAEERAVLARAIEIVRGAIAIPCTACRYCTDGCPKEIAIPDYFALYNTLKRFGAVQRIVASTYYENLAETHGKAADCIGCRQCERRCPQHLKVVDYLQEVSSVFDAPSGR
ncbi:aldo/keto reductase [Ligaoa zhengdingensis]|uniref:aldo/keto reductase n=2 Tax=Ligaoa zhengdingensis TaxID=2763658 RepID=UPI0031B9CC36